MTAYDFAKTLMFSLCKVLGATILALVILYQTALHDPNATSAMCTELRTPLDVECDNPSVVHGVPQVQEDK